MGFQNFATGRYGSLVNNSTAQDIYNFLAEPEQIFKMIEESKRGKAALLGCVQEVETQFAKRRDFRLVEYFPRQAVGAMVKEIMAPFGYVPNKQKTFSQGVTKFFTSATCYDFIAEKEEQRLVQKLTVEKVDKSGLA